MSEVNQNSSLQPEFSKGEPQPFRKAPMTKKSSREMIILILLVANIIISTISLVGVAYTVSKEKSRADQMSTLQNRGGMMFRNGGSGQGGNWQGGGFRQNNTGGQNGTTN